MELHTRKGIDFARWETCISIAQLLNYQTLLGLQPVFNRCKAGGGASLHRRDTVIELVLHICEVIIDAVLHPCEAVLHLCEAVLDGGELLVDIVADDGQLLQDCSTLVNGW